MNLEFRPFSKVTDGRGERELFRLSFPEAEGTPASSHSHHEWKFQSFPAARPSYQYVATCNSQVVGYYAALPFQYTIDGKSRTCGMVCDVMTHPLQRGKGIFTQIGAFATQSLKNEGIAFTTGYPIRQEVLPGHLKVGWKIVMQLPMYLRPVGTRSFLPSALKRLAGFLDPILHAINALVSRNSNSSNTYRTRVISTDKLFAKPSMYAEMYTDFFAKWTATQANFLEKTFDFLIWRLGAPDSDYRFVLIETGERLVGMAIVRPTTLKGIETLAVLDFMMLHDHLHASNALHYEIYILARALSKDAVACMHSPFWAKAYGFSRSLYMKSPAIFSLIVKRLDDSILDKELFDPDRWHLTWLDSDDL